MPVFDICHRTVAVSAGFTAPKRFLASLSGTTEPRPITRHAAKWAHLAHVGSFCVIQKAKMLKKKKNQHLLVTCGISNCIWASWVVLKANDCFCTSFMDLPPPPTPQCAEMYWLGWKGPRNPSLCLFFRCSVICGGDGEETIRLEWILIYQETNTCVCSITVLVVLYHAKHTIPTDSHVITAVRGGVTRLNLKHRHDWVNAFI